jgi:glycosyltransferase involved in cell wall biosynthesis
MRLSFVIPAYNEETYLPACLDSILAQTHGMGDSVEIIVVNNASSDRTREVALGFPGVRVVDEPRKGLTFARQAGFAASAGELIANVDADARLTPGWVERVLATFAEEPKLVAFSGPLIYYDLTPRQRVSVQVFYAAAFLVYAINQYVLRAGSMVQGGNFVLRREALEEIGGFNTAISFYGEDTDIARRILKVGKVKFTFDLRMFSSARRLKHEGMVTIAARYTINYFWTTFRKRPFTEQYIDIREQTLGVRAPIEQTEG